MRFCVRIFDRRGHRVLRFGAAAIASAAALIVAPACQAAAEGACAARDAAERAMRKALTSSATWKMVRKLPGTDRVFESSGTVDCHVGGDGLEWRTLKPFRSLVAMKRDSMVFEDEDGRREKPSGEMPHYADIRKATDAFANGGTAAFDDVFDVSFEALGEGRWRAVFLPRNAMLRGLVERLTLEGSDLPESAVIESGNGASSRIEFAERRRNAK